MQTSTNAAPMGALAANDVESLSEILNSSGVAAFNRAAEHLLLAVSAVYVRVNGPEELDLYINMLKSLHPMAAPEIEAQIIPVDCLFA